MSTEKNYIFENQQEVDEWFESTIDGISRCMSTEAHLSSVSQSSGDYRIGVRFLNNTRERLYTALGITEMPERLTAQGIADRSLLLTNRAIAEKECPAQTPEDSN